MDEIPFSFQKSVVPTDNFYLTIRRGRYLKKKMTELKSRIITKEKPNEIGTRIEHSHGKYLPDTGQYPRSMMRIMSMFCCYLYY
jgi:hypothetical protein